jgi:hypothetical protein
MSLKCTISPCKSCKNDCAFKGHENDFDVCKGFTATNGDMIKAMFPNVVNSTMDLVDVLNNAKSWWNAPYKRESEGKK